MTTVVPFPSDAVRRERLCEEAALDAVELIADALYEGDPVTILLRDGTAVTLHPPPPEAVQ